MGEPYLYEIAYRFVIIAHSRTNAKLVASFDLSPQLFDNRYVQSRYIFVYRLC